MTAGSRSFFHRKFWPEYQQVAEILSKKYPPVDLAEMPELIVVEADMIRTEPLKEPVSADPDDDMFIACAPASGSKMIVSGDGHRLDVNDFSGIEILKTKAFADRHPPNWKPGHYMARTKRKTPVSGITAGVSEKEDKQIANRA